MNDQTTIKRNWRILIVLFLGLTIILTGCGASSAEVFQDAWKQTYEVDHGRVKLDIQMVYQWTDEFQQQLNQKRMEQPLLLQFESFNLQYAYDWQVNRLAGKLQVNLGDLGLDASIYMNEQEYYLISPLFPKIITFSNDDLKNLTSNQLSQGIERKITEGNGIFLPETPKALQQEWEKLWHREDVSRLGTEILPHPAGDLKVRKFEVKLDDSILQQYFRNTINILAADTEYNAVLNTAMNSEDWMIEGKPLTAATIWEKYEELLQMIHFDKVEYWAYINKDGYLMEEEFVVTIKPTEAGEAELPFTAVQMRGTIQRWDFHRPIIIELPPLTPENHIEWGQTPITFKR